METDGRSASEGLRGGSGSGLGDRETELLLTETSTVPSTHIKGRK